MPHGRPETGLGASLPRPGLLRGRATYHPAHRGREALPAASSRVVPGAPAVASPVDRAAIPAGPAASIPADPHPAASGASADLHRATRADPHPSGVDPWAVDPSAAAQSLRARQSPDSSTRPSSSGPAQPTGSDQTSASPSPV